jgi:hypothetical protein
MSPSVLKGDDSWEAASSRDPLEGLPLGPRREGEGRLEGNPLATAARLLGLVSKDRLGVLRFPLPVRSRLASDIDAARLGIATSRVRALPLLEHPRGTKGSKPSLATLSAGNTAPACRRASALDEAQSCVWSVRDPMRLGPWGCVGPHWQYIVWTCHLCMCKDFCLSGSVSNVYRYVLCAGLTRVGVLELAKNDMKHFYYICE